jgi:menaquinone-dependent protoporphyrinogen oxidase
MLLKVDEAAACPAYTALRSLKQELRSLCRVVLRARKEPIAEKVYKALFQVPETHQSSPRAGWWVSGWSVEHAEWICLRHPTKTALRSLKQEKIMKKILIAYTTKSGSTAEIAQFIGKEMRARGTSAEVLTEVLPICEVKNLGAYDAVIVGAPMILGWHREAVNFLKKNELILKQKPLACFASALSLTKEADTSAFPMPIFQDPALAKAPKNPQKLSFKENFSTLAKYLAPMLTSAPQVKPVGAAFFAGKLDLARLNLINRLFVTLIVGAKPGDYRNWDAMRSWADRLFPALVGQAQPSPVLEPARVNA